MHLAELKVRETEVEADCLVPGYLLGEFATGAPDEVAGRVERRKDREGAERQDEHADVPVLFVEEEFAVIDNIVVKAVGPAHALLI